MIAKFATDIPSLTNWGEPFLLGPGSIHVAHTYDEKVSKKELLECVNFMWSWLRVWWMGWSRRFDLLPVTSGYGERRKRVGERTGTEAPGSLAGRWAEACDTVGAGHAERGVSARLSRAGCKAR